MTAVDHKKVQNLHQREAQRFAADHPRSGELYRRAENSLLGGVPMNWMKKWAGPFPVFVQSAKGAHFTDADGREYVDLCLGDTGAMTGHSPEVVADAVARRLREGITFMLPTEDALWVGEELQRRFGLPYWQFTLTATDANRFAIRIAREITGRPKILTFHY
jgi:glutamate-1-semialdehyde 2,1-aminomutase